MLTGLKTIFITLEKAFKLLQSKDPLVLSSSTAFFATFSLSPIIVVLVSLFRIYSDSDRVSHQLFKTIAETFGNETAREIESIVSNFIALESNWLITIAGSIFFLFVGTTLLGVIKLSIQKIWSIRQKSQLAFIKYHSRSRGTQVGLIVFTGILIMLSLYIDTTLGISLDYLQVAWPAAAITLIRFLNIIFAVVVVTIWFTVLFKILPDANVNWDTAISGGLLTGILFSAGKLGLGKILVHARVETIFGASASFALLLLFIFYCSFILYYGAAFTHVYGEMGDNRICASKYADEYEERIIGSSQV